MKNHSFPKLNNVSSRTLPKYVGTPPVSHKYLSHSFTPHCYRTKQYQTIKRNKLYHTSKPSDINRLRVGDTTRLWVDKQCSYMNIQSNAKLCIPEFYTSVEIRFKLNCDFFLVICWNVNYLTIFYCIYVVIYTVRRTFFWIPNGYLHSTFPNVERSMTLHRPRPIDLRIPFNIVVNSYRTEYCV